VRSAGGAGLRQFRRKPEPGHHAGHRGDERDYSQLAWLWLAQLVGAMGGAALMALHYGPHWKLTPDPAAKLGVFCTNAAVRSPLFNILSEALGTAVLVVVAFALGSRGVAPNGMGAGMGPWLVASLCGASASRWAARRGTRSTRRAIWVRGWFIGSRRFPAKADRTELCVRSDCGPLLGEGWRECW